MRSSESSQLLGQWLNRSGCLTSNLYVMVEG